MGDSRRNLASFPRKQGPTGVRPRKQGSTGVRPRKQGSTGVRQEALGSRSRGNDDCSDGGLTHFRNVR